MAYSGCEDVDECKSTSLNNCGVNTDCINTAGSYNCVCHPGFDDFIEDKGQLLILLLEAKLMSPSPKNTKLFTLKYSLQ